MTAEEIIGEWLPLNNPALQEVFQRVAQIQQYKKGERLYDIGDIQDKIYILWDGILRCYFIDETQTDITDSFMSERGMIANSVDVFCGEGEKPSVIGIETLTDVVVCEIPLEQVMFLMKKSAEMGKIYLRVLHQSLEFQHEINNKRLYLSGKQRYQWFLEKWPEVDKVASNHQIATFLGIRSESLSRLRRQKKENH